MWSPDGSVLIIGDALGTLHFFDVRARTMLLSRAIRAPGVSAGPTTSLADGRQAFAAIEFVSPTAIVAALLDSSVFLFTGVDVSGLRQGASPGGVRWTRVDASSVTHVAAVAVVNDPSDPRILLAGSGTPSPCVPLHGIVAGRALSGVDARPRHQRRRG